MADHTKGPWVVEDDGDLYVAGQPGFQGRADDRRIICEPVTLDAEAVKVFGLQYCEMEREVDAANMRHIVLCVNACQHLTDADLAGGVAAVSRVKQALDEEILDDRYDPLCGATVRRFSLNIMSRLTTQPGTEATPVPVKPEEGK